MDAADPDKRGNMKLMDQGREADNEFEEGKSVSLISNTCCVRRPDQQKDNDKDIDKDNDRQ